MKYVDGPGPEVPGRHLLGYALYMVDAYEDAVAQLKKTVNRGFDNDWQLLVEMQLALDRNKDEEVKRLVDAKKLEKVLNDPGYTGESTEWKDQIDRVPHEDRDIGEENGEEKGAENDNRKTLGDGNADLAVEYGEDVIEKDSGNNAENENTLEEDIAVAEQGNDEDDNDAT